MIMSLKQRKTKFKPGIKLNDNIDIEIYMGHLSMQATINTWSLARFTRNYYYYYYHYYYHYYYYYYLIVIIILIIIIIVVVVVVIL